MTSWVEKYRPKTFSEIKGQDLAVQTLKTFITNFYKGLNKKKAILLHGPPGTGKTTLAHVAAKELGAEIFELNASDLRNKSKLDEVLRPALEQKSLTKTKKIILVDEVDGISAVDRGGLPELLGLIVKTTHPIVITGNDIWDRKFNLLRQKSEIVKVKEVDYKTIKDILINILKTENKFVNQDILSGLAIKAKGDIRAAINDLQTISSYKPEDLKIEIFDERNKETDIFNALRLIFKNTAKEDMLQIYDSVNMPIDEIFLWIEENIPTEYRGKELYNAYEALSKADVFKGRIYKQQYWRFLVYENILLSYGIAAAKKAPKTGFTNYKKPSRILKIWLHNQKTAKKKSISEKYARHAHVSIKTAMRDFAILKHIFKNPETQKELKLSEEEIEYVLRN